MKKLAMLLVAPALMLASGWAMADSTVKIGVIDMQKAVQEAPDTAKLNKALTDQFKPRRDKLAAMSKNIQAEQDKYNKDSAVMNDKDRDALRSKIIADQSELQKSAEEYQAELNDARSKDIQQLLNKIYGAVDQIAKNEHFDMVIEKQAVPYVGSQFDITQEVIKQIS